MERKSKEIKVLMADDESDFLEAMTQALQRRGFLIVQAEDGLTALEALRWEVPDVVVLDVKMPGIDGVEVFQRIKRLVPDLPVVMLTGHGNIQQAFETSREGVFEYLTKPCDVEKLARVLRRAVEDRELVVESDDPEQEVRLLFVDDEEDLIASLKMAMERRHILVTTATGGDEAIALAEIRVFDVALIDIRMPGMNGLTLLNKLKKLNQHIEVIVLTGHPSMEDAVFGMKEGAFDFLTKPQPVDVLVGRIRAAFRRQVQNVQESRKGMIDEILEKQPD